MNRFFSDVHFFDLLWFPVLVPHILGTGLAAEMLSESLTQIPLASGADNSKRSKSNLKYTSIYICSLLV